MGTLKELYEYPTCPGLKERVAAACWREAKAIFTEADTVPNHTERIAWSVCVLGAVDAEAAVFAEMLRAVVTIKDTADVTDAEIESAVKITANHFATAGA